MNNGDQCDYSHNKVDGERLLGTITSGAIPIELVSAFAGDRVMTKTEKARVQELKNKHGKMLFSDFLYVISHRYFASEIAEDIWNKVLLHKLLMSEKLGRNVRITVATLDYLSNITEDERWFTFMSETYVAEIVNLSMRDGMTGLYNHSTCYELLELELRNHRRHGIGVALIMLDIDDFKSINDRWGHQEGDRVIVELAKIIKSESRDSDICCRFGGEEFAVILPYTKDSNETFNIAERIRIGISKITSNGQKITVSLGGALCTASTQTSYDLVERADRALFQAKRDGKNRVVMSDV